MILEAFAAGAGWVFFGTGYLLAHLITSRKSLEVPAILIFAAGLVGPFMLPLSLFGHLRRSQTVANKETSQDARQA